MIYEFFECSTNIIITIIGSSSQVSQDHHSYERNLSKCVEKPEKFSTLTGFKPVVVVVFSHYYIYMVVYIQRYILPSKIYIH